MSPVDRFTKEQQQRIVKAIEQAELNTSGEIRVHIENSCKTDVLDRAADVFALLKMHKTQLRNGVLFYFALSDRKFAILGDAGINSKVPNNFWDSIKEEMLVFFKQNDITSGLEKGILLAGEKLKEHFPLQKDDVNELSNEISFGD
ncbi:MAG: TPM domain-containing protein [Bacteroidales bacterium]|nr:TPM domain-containing protein [Bacteroidales bacterium]MBN2748241.1 TPM domain-containing protein [Bacteroidales bacterium]